jgi:hypothetical protein
MTQTLPHLSYIPEPAGAVWIGERDGDGDDLGRYVEHAPIDTGTATLTIYGTTRHPDGGGKDPAESVPRILHRRESIG